MRETQQNSAEALSGPRARLLELSQARGVSLAALSELVGRNPTYLQQFIRKGSPRKLEEQDRATLARFLGVGEEELREAQENSYAKPAKRESGAWIEVPRLALGAAAGPGALGADERPFDSFRFSRRWLAEQGLERAQLSAIRVEGDSMEPLLHDGDEILVEDVVVDVAVLHAADDHALALGLRIVVERNRGKRRRRCACGTASRGTHRHVHSRGRASDRRQGLRTSYAYAVCDSLNLDRAQSVGHRLIPERDAFSWSRCGG